MLSDDKKFEDRPLLLIEDAPKEIDILVECPKYITFPNNTVNIKAICSPELPTEFEYTYTWELKKLIKY